MNERVGQRLDDILVGFGFFAFQHQLYFLAEFSRNVSYQTREALEHKRNRHHAHLHDGILHFLGNAVDHRILRLDFARQFAHTELILCPLSKIGQRILGHHHFADQVHQPVNLGLIDLEALGTGSGAGVLCATAKARAFVCGCRYDTCFRCCGNGFGFHFRLNNRNRLLGRCRNGGCRLLALVNLKPRQ